jgi:hypothetical protein
VSSFDNKEQCNACGGYFHERSMTFDANQAVCYSCRDEQNDEGAKAFMARVADNGYHVIQTGGGCTAFAKRIGLTDIMVTQDASHEIYEDNMSDVGVVIGVYPDELEGQHLFFVNPTHTNWDMIFGLVEQAENVAKALDDIQAFQKIEA